MTQKLPALPPRIQALPRDHRGFPVPWFVTWFDGDKPAPFGVGTPDFRVADATKLGRAVKENRCWVCGGVMGVHKAFTIGPMCAINRTSAEPPGHRECAIFSATACPFLTRPRMRRNDNDLPDDTKEPGGVFLTRNPGVACVWLTKSYRLRTATGGVVFVIDDPNEVLWFCEGRAATRAEVAASIDSGWPLLVEMAEREGEAAMKQLLAQRARAMAFVPAE